MPPPLATAENLFDFFHEQVDDAVESTATEVSEEGVYYLAQLLTERGNMPPSTSHSTLVELRMQAQWGDRPQAIRAWRELGDKALYTVGFFRPSIERHNLDPTYYQEMGASAYDRLAHILGTHRGPTIGGGRGMDDVFAELAACFAACGEVLRDVRDRVRSQSSNTTDVGVLALYEDWITSGNRHAEGRLRELGVIPMPGRAGEDGAC